MKHGIIIFSAFIILSCSVTTSNAVTYPDVSVTLCLNAKGPISCQNYTVRIISGDFNMGVNSTIPNRSYPNAGIKTNSPKYSIKPCLSVANGYCLFTASNQQTLMRIVTQ